MAGRTGWLLRTGQGRLRTGLTVAGVLLIAASTQVVPTLTPPPVAVVEPAPPGLRFADRIAQSLARVAEAIQGAEPEPAGVYQTILAQGRQLLHFDPDANEGRGSWIELVGNIDERTETVGVLVPGASAFVMDYNFKKYWQRARHLVDQADGRLAMVVWAAGDFPKGWLESARISYQRSLGRALAEFSHELRTEIDRVRGHDPEVRIVVAGHSLGGSIVGTAERYGLDADAVLHIASSGMGRVTDPYDYPAPDRPRYAMTAPGDLIALVQGFPMPPGIDHGPDPDRFRCAVRIPTGRLPDDPAAPDEHGQPLGDRAGDRIGGFSSHSDMFIRNSDAWYRLYSVFAGTAPLPDPCLPPEEPEPLHARVLPLVVPRAVTASQCRAGGGLRPAGGLRTRPGGAGA